MTYHHELTREQHQAVVEDLVAFVRRVARDEKARDAEFSALADIARTLCYLAPPND